MRKSVRKINGVVISGKQVGRTMGFPTANISPHSDFPALDLGVYGVKVFWENNQYYGVMNVGRRPTIADGQRVTFEVHLFDFHGNLYNEELTVEVCSYIRQEKKFSHLDELKWQINKDVTRVKKKFGIMVPLS